jgi:DNA-binding MarR family transcriptional regulator
MTDTEELKALGRIMNELRAIEPDFPASYGAVLIYVKKHHETHGEWPSIAEVADNTGMARPNMSRTVQTLGDRRLGKSRIGDERPANARKSLKLVERIHDDRDLRMIRVKLSPKGLALINRMTEHLQ